MMEQNGQLCPSCGYKLAGIFERCPRCGTVVWPTCEGCKGCGLGSTCSSKNIASKDGESKKG